MCDIGSCDFCTVPLMWEDIIICRFGESVVQQVTEKTMKYGNETLFALLDQYFLQHSFWYKKPSFLSPPSAVLLDNLQQQQP